MSKLDSISEFAGNMAKTLASLAKIMILSRKSSVKRIAKPDDEIVVLGNGPSLNQTIEESSGFLKSRKKVAVNFAANTPVFFSLKPEFYVLADPHFFSTGNDNVDHLWENIGKADWKITLFIPTKIKSERIDALSTGNKQIRIMRYNTTPIEGFRWFCHFTYRHGFGMPRPRNVLIPSIMLAINSGFRKIYIAGADHSWTRTLSVDDQNRVVSIQPHFYKDNEKETTRVNTEYMRYPLYKIIYSFYVAFRSYFMIRDYAEYSHSEIWNITPGSFIDAFPRKKV